MTKLYDYALALIPTALGGGGLAHLTGIATDIGIYAGGVVGLMAVFYLLFVNPPRDPVFGPHQ